MNRHAFSYTGVAIALVGAMVQHGVADAQDPEAVAQAEVVFVGQVADADPQGDVYSVRVERLIRPEAPSPLTDFEGRNVRLRARSTLKGAQRAAFFTRIERIGEHLELAELAHVPLAADAGVDEGEEICVAALREQADRELSARLEQAQAVVVGRITMIREVQVAAQDATPLSEHSPEWKEAVIEVDEWLKGTGDQPATVAVRFSSSYDVMWYGSPKLDVGESGVFILSEIEPATAPGASQSAGELTDPDNMLSSDQVARVKRLLEE